MTFARHEKATRKDQVESIKRRAGVALYDAMAAGDQARVDEVFAAARAKIEPLESEISAKRDEISRLWPKDESSLTSAANDAPRATEPRSPSTSPDDPPTRPPAVGHRPSILGAASSLPSAAPGLPIASEVDGLVFDDARVDEMLKGSSAIESSEAKRLPKNTSCEGHAARKPALCHRVP